MTSSETGKPRRAGRHWPALIILGAACAFCWPVFAGRIMLPADMCLLMLPWRALQSHFPDFHRPYNPMLDPIQQYLPWRIYAVESVRAGFVPLWNPYAFCGTPFLANLQSTLLYPPNLLFLIAGARHGFGVSAILHLTLGGLFTYAFLRTLGLCAVAALFGALVLMFNGVTVAWLEFPTLSLWVFMWLPAILLCYERSLRAPRTVWPVLLAFAIALQFLGGHLQVSTYLLVAFLIYVITRCFGASVPKQQRSVRQEPKSAAATAGKRSARGQLAEGDAPAPEPVAQASRLRVLHAILLALVPLILGLALAAGQILPTLELARYSGRVAAGGKAALSTAFPITHLILYLVPNFFGNPVDYNYWGNVRSPAGFNFFETACYVGILPLFLAAWSLRRWREPSFWFFAALTIFAVLAAVGSPVYFILYHLAPGFRELAGLGRVLCLAAFGLAGLAALGLDDLLQRSKSESPRAAFTFGAVALIVAWGGWLIIQPVVSLLVPSWHFADYQMRQIIIFLILVMAASALIALRARARLAPAPFAAAAVMLLILDLFGSGLRFNPFTPASIAYPQTDSTRWLQEHVGHERFTSLVSSGLDWMPANAPMIFGLRDIHGSDSLRVRSSFELVSPPGAAQADYPRTDSSLMDELGVRYLMTRRELSGKWKLVHNSEAPIYENTEAWPRAYFTSNDGGTKRPVGFERDGADVIVLSVDDPAPGQLVLTDSYYPGWKAWVDGEPAEIARTKDGFRGVEIAAGRHTIEMRYEPAAYRVGLFISLVALALLAGAFGALVPLRRSDAAATAARS
jgi:hypothetical protein